MFFFRENILENKKRLKLISKKMKLPKKIIFIDDNQEFV